MTERTVLDAELALTPSSSRSSVELPFVLDSPAERLEIDFSYQPKFLEGREGASPIPNLVTISLDYGEEYLGCAHRHAPVQRHLIGAGGSSPGFHAAPVRAGGYRLVVSAHCVVTPACAVRVRVIAAGTAGTARTAQIPGVAGAAGAAGGEDPA
ncbi:MAG: hypothetical protein Q8M76_00680 [Spirochaetaceae bacterium]|nr:hypothetical protein [Spirochaetaceae bacterium]